LIQIKILQDSSRNKLAPDNHHDTGAAGQFLIRQFSVDDLIIVMCERFG